MPDDQCTMYKLRKDIRDTVRTDADILRASEDPDDDLNQMVGSAVPVYNGELAEALASDQNIGFPDPEVFEGADNVFDIIKRAIYADLLEVANEEWNAIQEEGDESEDE